MRGATRIPAGCAGGLDISIHAPHAGCDETKDDLSAFASVFQSTHPMRGATETCLHAKYHGQDFNPRTPCGVRQAHSCGRRFSGRFQSTHPIRGATTASIPMVQTAAFQSTHPMRGATDCRCRIHDHTNISIHAPHAGCDETQKNDLAHISNFNPRTPCGVRRRHDRHLPAAVRDFNPRTPCGVRQGKGRK